MYWDEDLKQELLENLSREDSALHQILDAIPETVILTNLNFDIIAVNDTCGSMLGYKPSELTGTSAADLSTEARNIEKLEDVGFMEDPEQQTYTYESHYITKEGEVLNAETVIQKLYNEKDQPAAYLGVIRNISERKQIEREIERFFLPAPGPDVYGYARRLFQRGKSPV